MRHGVAALPQRVLRGLNVPGGLPQADRRGRGVFAADAVGLRAGQDQAHRAPGKHHRRHRGGQLRPAHLRPQGGDRADSRHWGRGRRGQHQGCAGHLPAGAGAVEGRYRPRAPPEEADDGCAHPGADAAQGARGGDGAGHDRQAGGAAAAAAGGPAHQRGGAEREGGAADARGGPGHQGARRARALQARRAHPGGLRRGAGPHDEGAPLHARQAPRGGPAPVVGVRAIVTGRDPRGVYIQSPRARLPPHRAREAATSAGRSARCRTAPLHAGARAHADDDGG
mmetsp:Transcript_12225/g.44600  ORF Transcript_12225/g.44600 Transcript_12225/m.44600 type:complete len:282 (+) Transcript_12225:237-1082(+)